MRDLLRRTEAGGSEMSKGLEDEDRSKLSGEGGDRFRPAGEGERNALDLERSVMKDLRLFKHEPSDQHRVT